MTVHDIAGLHLKSGQFHSEQAPKDYVADNLAGFGKHPTSPDFGGPRLTTNGPGHQNASAHTGYLNNNTQAVRGIADVIDGKVPGSDVQRPGVDDYLGAAARNAVYPGGPALDWATRHYHGPDGGLLQAVDHAGNALADNVDVGVRDGTDLAESAAKKLWSWRP